MPRPDPAALLGAALPATAAADDVDTLLEWMTGSFSSARQAAEDTTYFDIRLEMAVNALEVGENRRATAGLAALRHEFPESAVVHALEGVALERIEDPERAVLAYRAALYLAPEMDEVRFLLARALEGQGRSRAAAREYRTALTGLGPAGGFMTAILGRLGFPDSDQMMEICRGFLKEN